MDIKNCSRLFITFIRIFAVLLIITMVLPWAIEQIISSIGGGQSPGADSIKVFKDFVSERAAAGRFLSVLKKLIIFM